MFDIGFSELLIIGVVALIVLGPERLPRVARTAGHLFGRMQRYVAEVKAQVNREMQAEEFRQFHTQVEEVKSAVQEMQTSVESEVRQTQSEIEQSIGMAPQRALDFVEEPVAHEARVTPPEPSLQMELPWPGDARNEPARK